MLKWRRWIVEFVALSFIQAVLFGVGIASTFLCLGINYLHALVIGVPFFLTIVLLNNLFVLLARPNWVKRLVTFMALAIHFIAWGEDLNTYFFTSALTGILFGGIVILFRKRLIAWLYFRIFPSTR